MKKILITLMLSLALVGCATTTYTPGVDPPKQEILVEAGLIGLASYAHHDDAIKAIDDMDEYLLLMYGTGPLGQSAKYTTASLVHKLTVQNIADPRVRRMVTAARIFMTKDGEFTGIDWLDALVMADNAMGEYNAT